MVMSGVAGTDVHSDAPVSHDQATFSILLVITYLCTGAHTIFECSFVFVTIVSRFLPCIRLS